MIDNLKKLVLEKGYDEESKQHIASLEDRLHKAMMAESLAENPVISDYVTYLTGEIDRCTYVLSHDDGLTESERNKIFARREMAEEFTRLFTTEKKAVEDEITQLLIQVKNA